MKRWDRRALEGLPLKLLIMSLLISLTAPVVMGSMESYERSTARSIMVAEAGQVVEVVEEVMSAGEGNRRIVTVTLPASADRFHLVLEIGGPLDRGSSLTVRCACDGLAFSTIAPESPPARMTFNGDTLRLSAGEHRLAIECVRVDGRTVASLEVMP